MQQLARVNARRSNSHFLSIAATIPPRKRPIIRRFITRARACAADRVTDPSARWKKITTTNIHRAWTLIKEHLSKQTAYAKCVEMNRSRVNDKMENYKELYVYFELSIRVFFLYYKTNYKTFFLSLIMLLIIFLIIIFILQDIKSIIIIYYCY